MTFEKQILARIKTEKLKPTPRVYFKLRNLAFWLLLIISVAALGLSFGMIIFMIESMDLALMEALNLGAFQKIIFSVPLFWIIASAVIATIAFINFRHTRTGYRLSALKFIIGAALISLVLGALVYMLNITRYVDEAASENIPIYNIVVPINTGSWFDPDNGLLSGTVREKDSESLFTLRDKEFVLWTVTGQNISLPADYSFHPGDRVRIIGTKTGDDTFEALQIHPWSN